MSWRDTLQGSAPTEQSEVSEQSPPESRILHNVQIVHGGVNPEISPDPTTDDDFKFAYFEAVDRIQAVLPLGMKTRKLANYSEIQRREEAIEAVWLEARRGGRHGELFSQFRATLAEWEAVLVQGVWVLRNKHEKKES